MATATVRRRAARWLSATLVAVAAGALFVASMIVSSPARADESTKVLLLLDVSGSMNEKISSGGTKFAAAKRALKQVAGALPAGTQVGLRVYGSQIATPKERDPKACTDSKLVLPIGPLDQSRMNQAVDSFTAKGETPIAYSLGKAVDDLGGSGKRVLILISDGEETCSGDPCPTARKLARSGVDLQFNAIGLAVGAKARSQLQCIANAGDGSYYDAGDTDDLSDALRKLTQRALRPLQIAGTPITATTGRGDAPTITTNPVAPGSEAAVTQYKDRYDTSNRPRYYRIERTPGSTVTASIASIVTPYGGQNSEAWTMALTTPDGIACGTTQATAGSYRAVSALGGSVSSSQVTSPGATPADACLSAPELLLSLARQTGTGNQRDVAVALRVTAEPAIDNLSALPAAVDDYDGAAGRVKAAGPERRVLGGTSFANAPAVEPGRWTDSLAYGETVFYAVTLQPGQRVRASVRAPASGRATQLDSADTVTLHASAYAPSQAFLAQQVGYLQGPSSATVTVASPQVRIRNREQPLNQWPSAGVAAADVTGRYYVAVQLEPGAQALTGRVLPVAVSLTIDGKVAGRPQYAQTSTTSTPTPSATPTATLTPNPTPAPGQSSPPPDPPARSSTALPFVIAVVAVAAGAVGLTVASVKRRRRPSAKG